MATYPHSETDGETLLRLFDMAEPWPNIRAAINAVLQPSGEAAPTTDYCGSCGKRGHYAGDSRHHCTDPDERPASGEVAPVDALRLPDPSWCDCDSEPVYGIKADRHLPSCRYGVVMDFLDIPDPRRLEAIERVAREEADDGR